jgi:hypothetical protein
MSRSFKKYFCLSPNESITEILQETKFIKTKKIKIINTRIGLNGKCKYLDVINTIFKKVD